MLYRNFLIAAETVMMHIVICLGFMPWWGLKTTSSWSNLCTFCSFYLECFFSSYSLFSANSHSSFKFQLKLHIQFGLNDPPPLVCLMLSTYIPSEYLKHSKLLFVFLSPLQIVVFLKTGITFSGLSTLTNITKHYIFTE